MAASLIIRDGLLDRLKMNSGLADDESFARAIGTSRSTLTRVRAGESPSAAFVAGICMAFKLSPGEVAEVVDRTATGSESSAA